MAALSSFPSLYIFTFQAPGMKLARGVQVQLYDVVGMNENKVAERCNEKPKVCHSTGRAFCANCNNQYKVTPGHSDLKCFVIWRHISYLVKPPEVGGV